MGSMDVVKQIEVELLGEMVTPGAKLAFKGVRGTFTFVEFAVNERTGSQWITCYGGRDGQDMYRSFHINDLAEVVSTSDLLASA